MQVTGCDRRAKRRRLQPARPRGATPCPKSGAEAGRTPCPKGRGQEELPHVRGRAGGAAERRYPASEARGCDREDQPHVQGAVAARAQEGLEKLSHVEGQEGSGEEIPLVQGKEQWLCFAGGAVKRYSMPNVRETQVRW